MNTQITPFAFDDKLLRTITDEKGDFWFVAKDVALALGYEWNGSARISHVPEEWRGVTSVVTPSGIQEMLTLSEQGLYFFLGRSDKPKALPYQKWIAGDVMPTMRRTGSYSVQSTEVLPISTTAVPDNMLFRINEFAEVKIRFTNTTLRIAKKIGLHDEQKICALFDEILILFSDEEPHYAKNISMPTETLCMLWNEVCHIGKASYKYSMSWRLTKFLELCHLVNNTFPTQKVKKDNLRLALCTHISSL